MRNSLHCCNCSHKVCAGYESLVCPFCMAPYDDDAIFNGTKFEAILLDVRKD